MNRTSTKHMAIGVSLALLAGGLLVVAIISGLNCAGRSGKGGKVTQTFDAQRAGKAVDRLLEQIRRNGLKPLLTVVDEADRLVLTKLEGKLQEQLKQAPRTQGPPAFDYRRDPGTEPAEVAGSDGRSISVVIRRCSGEGEFTFGVTREGKVVCVNEATTSDLSTADGSAEVLEGLPPVLKEFEQRLADPGQLRQIRLKNGGHVFAVVFGLAGNAERIDKVLIQRKAHDERLNQVVFHLIAFERAIQAEARLSENGEAVERLLRLGEKSPAEFFQERITSFESSE